MKTYIIYNIFTGHQLATYQAICSHIALHAYMDDEGYDDTGCIDESLSAVELV